MEWGKDIHLQNKEIIEKAGFEIIFDKIDGDQNESHLVVMARKK